MDLTERKNISDLMKKINDISNTSGNKNQISIEYGGVHVDNLREYFGDDSLFTGTLSVTYQGREVLSVDYSKLGIHSEGTELSGFEGAVSFYTSGEWESILSEYFDLIQKRETA